MTKLHDASVEEAHGASSLLPTLRPSNISCDGSGGSPRAVVGEDSVAINLSVNHSGKVPLDSRRLIVVLRVHPGQRCAQVGEETVIAIKADVLVSVELLQRLSETFAITFALLLASIFVEIDVCTSRSTSCSDIGLEGAPDATLISE